MKNPIPYTKEDIYLIVEMFENYSSTEDGGVPTAYIKYIRHLINCLTPDEREDECIQIFIADWGLEDQNNE